MDSMDNVRERFEVLEQRTEHLQLHTQALEAQTRTVGRRLRRWRLPWTVAAVATLGLALALPPAIQAKRIRFVWRRAPTLCRGLITKI